MKPMQSTHEKGEIIVKKLVRQRWLDLVLHEFNEQIRRNPGSEIILVTHHKLVNYTSHVNNPKIQALVGYAITKGYLKFKSAFEKDPTKVFHLSYKDRPMVDNNFKVFSVDKYCSEDYQAKIKMSGKAYAIPLCPKGKSEQVLKMFKFANKMQHNFKKELKRRRPW